MNDYNSNEIIKIFNNFREILETGIKNNINISNKVNECYLIDNKWYNELEKNIRDYENIKNKNNKQKVCLPQQFPVFINDIDKAIELLKSNNEPKLISNNILTSIYNIEKLKNTNTVKYISGFNNLIIMFMQKEHNNGLFIFNPLNKNITKKKFFSFITKNNKNIKNNKNKKEEKKDQLYSDLLQMKDSPNNNLIDKLGNNNKIENYKIYNDNENEDISHGNEEYIINSNENFLKIFISIFYYEKSLSSNMNEIFSKTQKFYLINPVWFIEFKNNYKYEKISESLSNYDKNNKIDYSNLEQNMNDILLYSTNSIKIDKIELSENLINTDYINPKLLEKNNISYYDKFHIIPFEIINSIKEYILGNNITVEPKEVFISQDNDIYIIDSLQIFFGKIDDKLLFITEYIFSYDSLNILNQEKEIINSTPIIEYIELKNCNLNDSNLQDLWDDESSKKIGKFITLNNIPKIEQKDLVKDDNPIKKGIIVNKKNSNTKNNLATKIKVPNNDNNHKEKRRERFHRRIDEIKSKENNSIKYNTQKIFNKSHVKEQNDLNNQSALEKLQKKIEKLEKDNESKIEEINKYKSILSEKEENIKKIEKDNNNIKNELETLKLNNNEIDQEKVKLLDKEKEINDKLKEVNKKEQELKNKEKEINNKEKEIKCKEKEIEKKQEEINNKENELQKNLKIQIKNNKEKEKLDEKVKENKKIQMDLSNKKKEISKLKDENTNYENEIKTLNIKLKDNNVKIGNLEKNIREFKSKIEVLTKNEDDYKKKIKEYESKINQFENNNNNIKLISDKEKEINYKISFLEDKENLIEKELNELKKEKIENQNIKQENGKLNEINKNLKKEIEEKRQQYNQILSNIEEINKKQNLKNISNNNIFFNSVNENQILSLKNEYEEEPILVGLNNIGATCFMNSVLQCLSQTKPLTDYFLNNKNIDRIFNNNIKIKNKNELQLSPVYYELIKQLWDKKSSKSFSPNNFMNQIEKMNPLFKQGQAGDSKDFIIFIFEQLHKELKRPVRGANQDNAQPLNQYDRNNAFNYFFNEFKKECSIISDIFFGFNETTNECLNCKNNFNSKGYNNPICYNYGIFNCLIFPLEEVKKMKYNNIQNNIVSIYECFSYQQKSEIFTGENRNYCNICKQVFDSIYMSKIYIGPNILVLILNRGKGNMFDVKLEFSETIDITQFVLQSDKPQLIYNLYGVITHIGQSGPNAHFVASCKSSMNKKWYRFNDAIISPISNIQKEVIEFGTPYILFYQKQ